jgi:predicted DNA-binding ribbon-helix-helix protein
MPKLINRNIIAPDGRRTSMRLSQDVWDAIDVIKQETGISTPDLIKIAALEFPHGPDGDGTLTASVRSWVLSWFTARFSSCGGPGQRQ